VIETLRNKLIPIILHHPRLYVSIGVGLCAALLGSSLGITSEMTQAIVGYDVGAIVYIFWACRLMYVSSLSRMRARALTEDDGKIVVLCLVIIALLFSTCAIFAELASVKDLKGLEKYESLLLALTTILASWFFTNIVFALHYAHDYYFDLQRGLPGGLIFLPLNEDPSYFDFLYFSFVLGATAQTADVTLCSKKMRRTVTLHSILAFFFNTTLLALTVNMASGLL
jgi:uncharacterized membrane protein